MANRATGKGRRAWADALLGRPWVLVAAVALVVALPVLVLGQASENDTRARLQATQVESAAHAAEVVRKNFGDRLELFRATLASLALKPRPADSPIGLAVQRGDVAMLQALADTVQGLHPRSFLRVYIAVRGQADTIDDATIVAISPANAENTALVGRRLSALTGNAAARVQPQLAALQAGERGALSDVYAGTADVPSGEVVVATSTANIDVRNLQIARVLARAAIVAELDFARTFADSAAESLAPGDDAYYLDGRKRLVGRARGPTEFPLRDLSGDPFVQLVGGPASLAVTRAGAVDPLGGGTRLIAGIPQGSPTDWSLLLLRDTSAVDRELDSVLGQLALARYLLVALLLLGAVVVAQAASVQIRQRRALADANDRIEAASLHKSAFLSSMSHELRTPLNSINGFSDVLLSGMGGTLTDQQREYLTDIRGSGEQLLALVNDVLDLSKVEAGKMELHPTEFDIRETVGSVHRVVAPLAGQKGQQLRLEDGDGGTVRLDEARLRQVLLNVLSNAVKYTPDGGTVATSISRRDGTVQIAVRDSGVGIAPEDQSRVFEDFTRVDAGYARTQQGTGLGLALARRLTRMMGGDITLASAAGQGSTFTITVPAAEAPGV